MKQNLEQLILKLSKKYIWDEGPIFVFTSDIDWASEDVMDEYFKTINPLNIKPTLFVTHYSKIIEENFTIGNIDRGIHPNFLNNSSHGSSFEEIIETCIKFAPESYGFRSHKLFDVSDITHLLKDKYDFKYVSNLGTIMHNNIKPILHESGLIHFPIFFEDGTHLFNELNLDFKKYIDLFTSPGIKIISFHPMDFVFNTPEISYMRKIKDSLTREEFNNIKTQTIKKNVYIEKGIKMTIMDIIEFVKNNNYPIFSLNELYNMIVK